MKTPRKIIHTLATPTRTWRGLARIEDAPVERCAEGCESFSHLAFVEAEGDARVRAARLGEISHHAEHDVRVVGVLGLARIDLGQYQLDDVNTAKDVLESGEDDGGG